MLTDIVKSCIDPKLELFMHLYVVKQCQEIGFSMCKPSKTPKDRLKKENDQTVTDGITFNVYRACIHLKNKLIWYTVIYTLLN